MLSTAHYSVYLFVSEGVLLDIRYGDEQSISGKFEDWGIEDGAQLSVQIEPPLTDEAVSLCAVVCIKLLVIGIDVEQDTTHPD